MLDIREIIGLVEQNAQSIIQEGTRKTNSDTFLSSLSFTRDGAKYILFLKAKKDTVTFWYGYSFNDRNGEGKEYMQMKDSLTETMLGADLCRGYADEELRHMASLNEPACELHMDELLHESPGCHGLCTSRVVL